MNAKQAMRKAKKLAEQEAATRAKAEQEKDYALYYLILELDKLEWIDDARAGECLVARWPFGKEDSDARRRFRGRGRDADGLFESDE